MGDLELTHLTTRAIGMDIKLATFFIEARGDAMKVELGIIKISQYGVIVCHVHGQIVVRAQPQIILGLVAVLTFNTANKIRLGAHNCTIIH